VPQVVKVGPDINDVQGVRTSNLLHAEVFWPPKDADGTQPGPEIRFRQATSSTT
jgi:hypothetical protein